MKVDKITDDIIALKRAARKDVNRIERNITNGMNSKKLNPNDRFKCVSLLGSLKRMKRFL